MSDQTPSSTISTAKKDITELPRNATPWILPGHGRPIQEVHFRTTEDGIFMLSACLDKRPMLRDGITGDWIGTFVGHKGAVWSAKLNHNATKAVTGGADFCAKVWDAVNGFELAHFDHPHIVKTVDISRDSKYMITGCKDKKLRVFDLQKVWENQKKQTLTSNGIDRKAEEMTHKESQDDTESSTTGNTNTIIAEQKTETTSTGTDPGIGEEGEDKNPKPSVYMGGEAIYTVKHPKDVNVVLNSLEKYPSLILTGCDDGLVRVFDMNESKKEGWEPQRTINLREGKGGPIVDMDVSLDGTLLAVAAGSCSYFIDLATFETLHSHPAERPLEGISISPDKRSFITGGTDLWVRHFDLESGNSLGTKTGHHGPVHCLRFSPNGDSFASGADDATIRLWYVDEKNDAK
eukprot:g1419.t1